MIWAIVTMRGLARRVASKLAMCMRVRVLLLLPVFESISQLPTCSICGSGLRDIIIDGVYPIIG